MPFDIHTALKQLDVTLKQVKKTRAQLPKLNREKVDQELKILLLDLQLLQTDLTRKADASYWKQRDEERRVFYVGMTRARNTLNIVRSQSDREFSEAF